MQLDKITSVADIELSLRANQAQISDITRVLNDQTGYYARESARIQGFIATYEKQLRVLNEKRETGASQITRLCERRKELLQHKILAEQKTKIQRLLDMRAKLEKLENAERIQD